jgi:hypothetical protein
LTRHESYCQHKQSGHSDAAKRFADTYNLHKIGAGYDAIGKWIAIALADGTSDDVLYDNKLAAVTHQRHNEQYFAFVKIAPPNMAVCDAEIMLETHRRMYTAGMRMTDPDHKHGGPDLITRLTVSDQLAQSRMVVQNLQMPFPYDRKRN